ncbi:MAG: (d)CMP kinase [Simkaniaceae bacterium]|nr:(d)CMP kinase [Simkaniaceae bacterium]
MIITIDGPSGTGKTTTAKLVAEQLGFLYLDTGAMYRAFALYILNRKLPIDEKNWPEDIFQQFHFSMKVEGSRKKYFLSDQDVTSDIRSANVTKYSSEIAKFESVRHHIVALQRQFAQGQDVVMEGRDLGSVVFPHAECKFFLKARSYVRAERRFAELKEKFPDQVKAITVEKILEEQSIRDANDSNRKISPLICPEDAIVVDTSDFTIGEVVQQIVNRVKKSRRQDTVWGKIAYYTVRGLVNLCIRCFYHIKVYGKENIIDGAAIIASNHTSFLDPPIISCCCPKSLHFLARASLFKHFFFGRIISFLNAHPITGGVSDISLFSSIERLILQGKKVVMFPEGRRARSKQIEPFKRGLGWIVGRTGAPVIPVYIHGAFEVWPRSRKLPKLFKTMICIFGKPIYFSERGSLNDKQYQAQIASQVEMAVRALQQEVESNLLR